jgi:4'-phosphopantetheinyl transferase
MILKNNIYVWYIDINEEIYSLSLKQINILNKTEKVKFDSFKFEEDKSRFIVSHIALRKIINQYTNIPLNLIKFKYSKSNKPYLKNRLKNKLFFNLSHSHNKAVIAISDVEVGVDIEHINDSFDVYELTNIIFSSDEKKYFGKLNTHIEKQNYFYTIWTKKEAYLKALSIGLVDNLNKINICNKIRVKDKIKGKHYIVNPLFSTNCKYISAISYHGYNIRKIHTLNYNNFIKLN